MSYTTPHHIPKYEISQKNFSVSYPLNASDFGCKHGGVISRSGVSQRSKRLWVCCSALLVSGESASGGGGCQSGQKVIEEAGGRWRQDYLMIGLDPALPAGS